MDEVKEFEQKLLACVHCGFCLTACPTYTRLGDEGDSPRGRIYLMRAVHEGRLEAEDYAVRKHIDQCVGCRACETVCPSGVEYGWLLERARDQIRKASGSSFMAQALLFAFGRKRMDAVVSAFSRLLRFTRLPLFLAKAVPKKFGKIKFSMAMLAASAPAKLSRTHRSYRTHRSHREKVALLTGCVQAGLYGRVNRDTEYVLRQNGFAVLPAPDQQCCGALHAHSGELDQSRQLARRNIEAFERTGADLVVVNAAGCGAQMKQYAELLEHDAEWRDRAKALVARVRDVAELLVGIELKQGAAIPMRVTYDAPCHLYHAQRITTAPLAVLAAVPGLDLVPLPHADECCGGAGIYGLLHQDLGGRILKDKVAAVVSTGADAVVTPNPGCMMQIGAGLIIHDRDIAVLHPIELLAESYRRAE
ncbi:MAG: (Fe-S)-binding protein [Gemmatimonadota bacterium]